MSKGRIVVLAGDDDPHLALVQGHLEEQPLVVSITSPYRRLSYRFESNESWPIIQYGDEELDLGPGAVKSIWCRRLDIRSLKPGFRAEKPEETEYAISSLDNFANALPTFFHPDVFWVSERQAMALAAQKPLQLVEARKSGLKIPETLFTADPAEARRFVEKHGACVIKTLAKHMPDGRVQYAMVRRGKTIDFAGLEVNPQIFQERIEPDFEIRAAVIGEEVFAAVVTDQNATAASQQGIRDFRTAFITESFAASPFALPRVVSDACVDLVRRLGTVCGFIDLIVDRQGEYWFIENNPNGQWAFVDPYTVNNIAEAIARLLESGKSPW